MKFHLKIFCSIFFLIFLHISRSYATCVTKESICADADGNRSVDILDAFLTASLSAKHSSATSFFGCDDEFLVVKTCLRMDSNSDNIVNIIDALRTAQWASGLPSSSPQRCLDWFDAYNGVTRFPIECFQTIWTGQPFCHVAPVYSRCKSSEIKISIASQSPQFYDVKVQFYFPITGLRDATPTSTSRLTNPVLFQQTPREINYQWDTLGDLPLVLIGTGYPVTGTDVIRVSLLDSYTGTQVASCDADINLMVPPPTWPADCL